MFGFIKKLFAKPTPDVAAVAEHVVEEPIKLVVDDVKIEEITAQIYEAINPPKPKRKSPAKKRQEKRKEAAVKKTVARKKKAAESDE